MPGDPSLVTAQELDRTIRRVIADVLVISEGEVQPGKALVRDLGAESIDFLDLVFHLEDALRISIPIQHWQAFVMETCAGQDLAVVITPEVIQEFAVRELRSVQA